MQTTGPVEQGLYRKENVYIFVCLHFSKSNCNAQVILLLKITETLKMKASMPTFMVILEQRLVLA